MAAQGLDWVYSYVLLPLVIIPFFAFLAAAGISSLFGFPDPRADQTIFFSMVLCFYLLLGWLVYFQPRRDYLILHERGFRVGITFKRRTIAFEDLAEFGIGRGISAAERFLRQVAALSKPGMPDWGKSLDRTALTLRLKDGKHCVYKAFFVRFHPADTVQFLEHMGQHHPDKIVVHP